MFDKTGTLTEGRPVLLAVHPAPGTDEAGAGGPVAFCSLFHEAALARLRELGRLEAAAETGWAATAGLDRRSRLPDALDTVLRAPAMTARRSPAGCASPPRPRPPCRAT